LEIIPKTFQNPKGGNMTTAFLEQLINYTEKIYKSGFESLWYYILISICAGILISSINVLSEGVSKEDLTKWGSEQTVFVVSRFFVGFLWPAYLYLIPALVPIVAIFCVLLLITIPLMAIWPKKA
jgi:hypothetical protein